VAVINSSKGLRVARLGLLVLAVVFAGTLATQSTAQSRDAQIAERLQPIGSVCLAGEACAGGTSAPAAASTAGAAAGEFNAEQTYAQSCGVCHNPGMAGAPRLDDGAAWAARIADKGMETVVANAINGINAMPARGMCMTCSDEDIAALVEYIAGYSQ
jgi:cytochrome c5